MVVAGTVARRRRRDTTGPGRDRTFGITGPLGAHWSQVLTQTLYLVWLGTGICLVCK